MVGAGGLRPAKIGERVNDSVPPPDPPLSAPATIGATISKDVSIIVGTTTDKGRAQFEGPHADDA